MASDPNRVSAAARAAMQPLGQPQNPMAPPAGGVGPMPPADPRIPQQVSAPNPYANMPVMDPNRAMWSGILMDIGNFVGSAGSRPMGTMGQDMYAQAVNSQYLRQQSMDNWQAQQLQNRQRERELAQRPNPWAEFPADYQLWKLSGTNESFSDFKNRTLNLDKKNVQSVQVDQDGNLLLVRRDGSITKTPFKQGAGKNEIVMVGNVPYVKQTLPGGSVSTRPLEGSEFDYRGSAVGRETMDQQIAEANAGLVGDIRVNVPSLMQQLEEAKGLRAAIANGEFDETGFIEGRWKQYTNAETAQLKAKSVLQLLQNLQITKLTPVSNFEIALVEGMYADILKDPQANIGALDEAIALIERKLALVRDQYDYYQQNDGTLEGYEAYIMSNNPFASDEGDGYTVRPAE